MMFAATPTTRLTRSARVLACWMMGLVLLACAGQARGQISIVQNIEGISEGQAILGTVPVYANVVGTTDVVLFQLTGPVNLTFARQGNRPSFIVDPETGEDRPWDTTTVPDGRYELKVTAVMGNGTDRSLVVNFRVQNSFTETEQNGTVSPVQQGDIQAGSGAGDNTSGSQPQVVVVGDQDNDTGGLVTVVNDQQTADGMPGVAFVDAPGSYTRGSNTALGVAINGNLPVDGDVLAIAWSITESRMIDDFAVRIDNGDDGIDPAKLDLLPPGEVEVQLLVRRSSQVHEIVRHRMAVVAAAPPAPELPEVGFNNPPRTMTLGNATDLPISIDGDLPEGADVLVLAWSDAQSQMVKAFTVVLNGSGVVPASMMELLPAGSVSIQLLTRVDNRVVRRTRHEIMVHHPDPPAVDPTQLPAIGFEAAPPSYQQGAGAGLSIAASGPMPSDADIVVVAWSTDQQRMVEEFAHTLGSGVWTIDAQKLHLLPEGEVELQLLVRRSNQVRAIIAHEMTIVPPAADDTPDTPDTGSGNEPASLPAVQFGQTPASYTVGSGQSIAINATGAFPDGADLLVIAWSSAQGRLVDDFAFTLTDGPLVIPASQLDLLPNGEVVLQLLPREDNNVYSQVTHTLTIQGSTLGGGGSGNGNGNNGNSGNTGGDAGNNDNPGNGTDNGSDDPADTGDEPDDQPQAYGVAFASSAAGVYTRGSGATLPMSVAADLPAGSTLAFRAWSNTQGAYVDAFTHTIGSAPWRVASVKLELLDDGQYRIDATLSVPGQAAVSTSHTLLVRTASGQDVDISPAAVYDGFSTFQPASDTQVIYVSSSTGNDANDGLSPESAVRTPGRGYALLRDDKPDWLLFRRGDHFQGGLGAWNKSGRSTSQPMIVGSYGPSDAPRPKFYTDGDGLLSPSGSNTVAYVVFSDLHGYANQRDPQSPDFVDGRTREFGVRWWVKSHDILFENLLLEYYAFNLDIGGRDNNDDLQRLTLNRCILRYAYSPYDLGHSQGMGGGRVRDLRIIECVFDHNGWIEGVDRANRTGFNQNVYLYQIEGLLVRGCTFTRGSNIGLKLRSDDAGAMYDAVVEDNVFLDNLTGMSVGSDPLDGDLDAVTHLRLTVRGNVFSQIGGPVNSNTILGIGLSLKQTGDVLVENNLFIDKGADTNWYAIEVSTWMPMHNVNIRQNIVHRWPASQPFINRESDPDMTLSGNLVELDDHRYIDPDRSVYGYLSSRGHGSIESLVAAMMAQPKSDPYDGLRGPAIVGHVRDGFELTPFD